MFPPLPPRLHLMRSRKGHRHEYCWVAVADSAADSLASVWCHEVAQTGPLAGESARIFKSEVKTMQDNDQDEDPKAQERSAVEGQVIDPTADVHKSRERRDYS